MSKPAVLQSENPAQRVFRGIFDVVHTALLVVGYVLELVVGSLASLLLFPLALLWSVPLVGRLLRWAVNLVHVAVQRLLKVFDMLLWAVGIRPEKRLRVRLMVVKDDHGPTMTREAAMTEVQNLLDIFRDQANVRVIPDQPWVFRTPFHGPEKARDAYVSFLDKPRPELASLSTTALAAWQDLWLRGMWFELLTTLRNPWGNLRRLLGYGAPIMVFTVREYSDEPALGFSMGLLTDHCSILREEADDTTAAHEVAHSCGIFWHSDDPVNLMSASPNVRILTSGQALWLRTSRHVTYL